MNIEKELEKKRDHLVIQHFADDSKVHELQWTYRHGFNAAIKLLLPGIESLEKIAKPKYGLQGFMEEGDADGEREYLAQLAFGYEAEAREVLKEILEKLLQ